jgi:hypothetical protein
MLVYVTTTHIATAFIWFLRNAAQSVVRAVLFVARQVAGLLTTLVLYPLYHNWGFPGHPTSACRASYPSAVRTLEKRIAITVAIMALCSEFYRQRNREASLCLTLREELPISQAKSALPRSSP